MNNLDFNYFCGSCTRSDSYRLAHCFRSYKVRHFNTGDYLAQRGDRAYQLSVLVRGSVTTQMVLDSGIVYTSARHSSPYAIGALALFAHDNHYRADIIALSQCDLISVSVEDIEQQMVECRDFMRSFMAYHSTKLDMFARHLSVLTHRNLTAKLAFYIFSCSENLSFRFDKRIGALATYLCVERPSLSRAISQLVARGLITYDRGEGRILDARGLRNLLQ